MTKTLAAALTAGLLLAVPASAFAQAQQTQAPPPDPQAPPSEMTVPLTPEQLEKIRKAIQQPSVLGGLARQPARGELPTFRAETVAPQVDFNARLEEFMKGDMRNGPVRGATMTHQEFLAMVTPKELYGSGGISPLELLQGAVVNWAVHASVKQIQEWRAAREAAELAAIRERINRELAALRGGR